MARGPRFPLSIPSALGPHELDLATDTSLAYLAAARRWSARLLWLATSSRQKARGQRGDDRACGSAAAMTWCARDRHQADNPPSLADFHRQLFVVDIGTCLPCRSPVAVGPRSKPAVLNGDCEISGLNYLRARGREAHARAAPLAIRGAAESEPRADARR
jgi:hypothetical protein